MSTRSIWGAGCSNHYIQFQETQIYNVITGNLKSNLGVKSTIVIKGFMGHVS